MLANLLQLNFATPDPTVPEVRQNRKGVVSPEFFSFTSVLILSSNQGWQKTQVFEKIQFYPAFLD